MINEKVSILTPCLNGEKFINRYLDSILNIMKQNLRLSKSEKEIMDKFWENEGELTCTELVDASPDRSWRKASAYLLINSLLEKGFIEVSGFRKSTKNYARIFKAKFSYEDYAIKIIMVNSTADSRKKLMYKLINEATLEELEEMKEIIEKARGKYE